MSSKFECGLLLQMRWLLLKLGGLLLKRGGLLYGARRKGWSLRTSSSAYALLLVVQQVALLENFSISKIPSLAGDT